MPVAAMWISAPLTLATATEDRRYAWMWAFGIVAIVVFAWLSFVGWRRGWNGGLAFLLGMPAFFLNLLTLFAVLLVALGFEIT